MADLLIDTDVFVDHLRGARHLTHQRHRIHYSVVTRAELMAGTPATEVIETLLAPFMEIPIDRAVANHAGQIRREARIALPDALIAASALQHGLTIVSRNASDFAKVRGLKLRTPK